MPAISEKKSLNCYGYAILIYNIPKIYCLLLYYYYKIIFMKVLLISDKVVEHIYSNAIAQRLKDID